MPGFCFYWLFCVITEVHWSMLGGRKQEEVSKLTGCCVMMKCVFLFYFILFYFTVIW